LGEQENVDFLRQNRFFVVLVAVVVVIGGALVGLSWSVSGDVEQATADRATLSGRVNSLGMGQAVNEAILGAHRKRLDGYVEGAKAVAGLCVEWNRRSFADPNRANLLISAKAEDGSAVIAFPVKVEQYRVNERKFTQDYIDKLDGIARRLVPAAPPTQAEVEDRVKKFLERLPPAPDGAPAAAAEDMVRQVKDQLRAEKAARKLIYADITAMDRRFKEAQENISPKDLWEGQVNLWVQSDIVDAITAANREALRLAGQDPNDPAKYHVARSAVKRLMRVGVDRAYVLTRGPTGGPGGAAGGLTQRIGTKEYDVVRYEFVVLMPFRYVSLLEQKLMEQNLHTILQVSMAEMKDQAATAGDFYGADPVLQVTIHGELLLLTAWQRPLMPPEFPRG
jgi:hypothetical protein